MFKAAINPIKVSKRISDGTESRESKVKQVYTGNAGKDGKAATATEKR